MKPVSTCLLAIVLAIVPVRAAFAQSYTISPSPYLLAQNNSGAIINNACIWTYQAGTTTPATTYADNIGTPNINPIRSDSAGRFTSYLLAGTSYKYVYESACTPPAHGTVLRTADNILAMPGTSNPTTDISTVNLRLTLTTGTPVTISDVTAATTIYIEPYRGNRIALYDGSTWSLRTITAASFSVPATASTMYDIFAYDSATVPTYETLAWTNDTTRATALTTQDGVLVKTGAVTRRYLGSFRTTTVSGQTEDSATKRFLFNYYNRQRRQLSQSDLTASWPYSVATWEQQRATATNQVEIVQGVAESVLTLRLHATASNATGGDVFATVGIGEDSTTVPLGAANVGMTQLATATANYPLSAELVKVPAVGYHKYVSLEAVAAVGVTTWYGASTSTAGVRTTAGTGLFGWCEG